MKINDYMIRVSDMTESKLHYYESTLETNAVKNNIIETTVDPVVAGRWYGNFYGLLLNELDISPNAAYINMRINGYRNSLDYEGNTVIKILDPEAFTRLLVTYNQNEALKKSLL